MDNQHNIVRRGEIYYADLSPVVGSEQGGMRPVLIVQNDVGNKTIKKQGGLTYGSYQYQQQ